ncbi:uncharacterized protein LOC115169277 isoform X1 [Salmo trutta]|uniref:uncharacterized protein LOC115169277 isoform X1 n=1 Tax=Salmo trutta TaxID=8032 RepID=UPI0011320AA7|nr:uncharacterized protein LOC115169277 isoform X1 [Salmo trutta]
MIRTSFILVLLTQLYLIQNEEVNQPVPLTTVQLGDSISLSCLFADNKRFQVLYWYKQTIGQMPHVVAAITDSSKPVLSGKFNNLRFKVDKAEDVSHLIISNISTSDEATYYCAVGTKYQMDYRNGTFLATNGDSGKRFTKITLEQQPESDLVHPGDSVTLQCTVLSETCTGEHSVYWFRAGSGESHPGVIYTPGKRSDECEKSPETPSPTQSCVYSLSKNNLSLSDAGTYYCALATCGEILLGNGTKLHIEKAADPVIIALGATLALSVTVISILVCTRNTRPICEHCYVGASQDIGHDSSTVEQLNGQDEYADTLNYAALNFSERKTKRGRKKRETPQESVYSDVRHSDWD